MSTLDTTNVSDITAQVGRTIGVEAVAGIAQGAYDRNATAAHDGQSLGQQLAQTDTLVKHKVLPHLDIDGSKSMSGEAMPSDKKLGDAIGDLVHPGKPGEGQSKGGHRSNTAGDTPPSSGPLPRLEKTAEIPARKF